MINTYAQYLKESLDINMNSVITIKIKTTSHFYHHSTEESFMTAAGENNLEVEPDDDMVAITGRSKDIISFLTGFLDYSKEEAEDLVSEFYVDEVSKNYDIE